MGLNRIKATLLQLRSASVSEAGQGLAEFGLILALVAVVCIGALSSLGVGIATSAGFVALPSSL